MTNSGTTDGIVLMPGWFAVEVAPKQGAMPARPADAATRGSVTISIESVGCVVNRSLSDVGPALETRRAFGPARRGPGGNPHPFSQPNPGYFQIAFRGGSSR